MTPPLSPAGRLLVLATAFLGWFCAGLHLSITSLAMRPAAIDLLGRAGRLDPERFQEWNRKMESKALSPGEEETLRHWQAAVARWFAWYQCAFLFGAASGGLVFGWLGDRLGRARGMGLSILAYSCFTLAATQAAAP